MTCDHLLVNHKAGNSCRLRTLDGALKEFNGKRHTLYKLVPLSSEEIVSEIHAMNRRTLLAAQCLIDGELDELDARKERLVERVREIDEECQASQ